MVLSLMTLGPSSSGVFAVSKSALSLGRPPAGPTVWRGQVIFSACGSCQTMSVGSMTMFVQHLPLLLPVYNILGLSGMLDI
eukprot:430677-Lingulodinium_polyedra.AAC.1